MAGDPETLARATLEVIRHFRMVNAIPGRRPFGPIGTASSPLRRTPFSKPRRCLRVGIVALCAGSIAGRSRRVGPDTSGAWISSASARGR